MSSLPGASDRVAWLEGRISQLREEWEHRFGRDCFKNPKFAQAFLGVAKAEGLFPILEDLFRKGSQRQGGGRGKSFETRYRESAMALEDGAPVVEDPVPLDPFDYLGIAVAYARQVRSSGLVVDLRAAESLVGLASQILEDPALSAFRRDILERFPSKLTPPMSVVLGPGGKPERPEPPPRIELESFVGKVFRGYKIVRVLGRGGFGAVFLAEHPTLPLRRALKIFLEVDRSGSGFERFRERCIAEARLQATLKDPNIVEVVDVFEDQGYVILVMEYVEGPHLGMVIEEKNRAVAHLEPLQVLDLAIPVARGLSRAHRLGVVHRDLKPENILLDEAHDRIPKIADFGLARHLEESGQRHHTFGHLVGTPIYMAPEQVATKAATYDHRCDIYSLGILMYQLSVGLPPFDDEEPLAILAKHEKVAPKPPSLKLDNFPEEFERIILVCLEKRPRDRFRTADELLQALEACRKNVASGITHVERQVWERRRTTRSRRALALAVAALVVFAAAFAAAIGLARTKEGSNPHSKEEVALTSTPDRGEHGEPRKRGGSSRKDPSPEAAAVEKKISSPATPASPEPKDTPPPKKREPKPAPIPLRDQILRYPVTQEEQDFTNRMLGAFSSHRAELLARRYQPLARELDDLATLKKTEYADRLLNAAREIVRLAEDLVSGRQREIAASKDELRLALAGGGQVEGRVSHADGASVTLVSSRDVWTKVAFNQLAAQEFLREGTLPIAEVAFQALSGQAGKALSQAIRITATREQVLLWYPVLARLLRLEIRELASILASKAEESLPTKATRKEIVAGLAAYPTLQSAQGALSAAEKEILELYPFLPAEFEGARRDAQALDTLLDRSYSRVAALYPGSEAYPAAATLLLMEFTAGLEEGHDDLIAKRGWINYNWELRPDPATREERLQYWDVLDGGGCVLRDPAGPRSLIMGRAHPRPGEGMLIKYDFESLGEEGSHAEWRLNLKREGGQNSYLRFDQDSVSLWPFGLGSTPPERPLASAKLPHSGTEPVTHTCVLIPGEGLHVFLDGMLVTTFAREDAVIPSQPSLVVLHGKLSARSIQVKKKPENPGK